MQDWVWVCGLLALHAAAGWLLWFLVWSGPVIFPSPSSLLLSATALATGPFPCCGSYLQITQRWFKDEMPIKCFHNERPNHSTACVHSITWNNTSVGHAGKPLPKNRPTPSVEVGWLLRRSWQWAPGCFGLLRTVQWSLGAKSIETSQWALTPAGQDRVSSHSVT